MNDPFWDARFGGDDFFYGTEPCPFLVAQAGHLPPGGRVLLPGDGEGRHGTWLARRGLSVLSVDSSAVGLEKARRLAVERAVSIDTEHADLTRWPWPMAAFDGIVSLFLHFAEPDRARIHADMKAALRLGGVLILEAFRPMQLAFGTGGPRDPALLYTAQDLRADFADMEILSLAEVICALDAGTAHRGTGATVRLVARKPGL